MNLKDEIIYDFSLNIPRLLITGNMTVIDNIRKVEIVSEKEIVVKSGKRFASLKGENLYIKSLDDERMLVEGEIREILFYGSSDENKG